VLTDRDMLNTHMVGFDSGPVRNADNIPTTLDGVSFKLALPTMWMGSARIGQC